MFGFQKDYLHTFWVIAESYEDAIEKFCQFTGFQLLKNLKNKSIETSNGMYTMIYDSRKECLIQEDWFYG